MEEDRACFFGRSVQKAKMAFADNKETNTQTPGSPPDPLRICNRLHSARTRAFSGFVHIGNEHLVSLKHVLKPALRRLAMEVVIGATIVTVRSGVCALSRICFAK